MSESLHDRIVALIPSKDLRDAIRSSGYQLSGSALLSTAYHCAPDFFVRTEYLKLLEAALSGDLKAYAARLRETQQQMLDAFEKAEPNTVYELHIKDTPDAYDERYLCSSFEAARKLIPLFYQEYDCGEKESSRYRIVKRRIFSAKEGEAFSEDYIGEMTLLPGGVIHSVEMDGFCAEDCDGLCGDCRRHCVRSMDVPFPRFTNHGDPVRYRSHDGAEHFGVVLQWNDAPAGECYIIPLDSEQLRYQDFEHAHYGHEHIPAVFVERFPESCLPEEMRRLYQAYSAFLKENPT